MSPPRPISTLRMSSPRSHCCWSCWAASNISGCRPSEAKLSGTDVSDTRRPSITGLRRFMDPDEQRDWLEGKASPRDTDERTDDLELRFKYAARFEKLLRRPQAQ